MPDSGTPYPNRTPCPRTQALATTDLEVDLPTRAQSSRLPWIALGLAVLSLLLHRLSFGAVGVTLDTRQPALVLAVIGLVGAVVGLRRSRSAFGLAAIALAGWATALLLWDLLLVYRTEEVAFSNGDVTLAGTLFLPRGGDAPYPALIYLHGAGAETRHEGASPARLLARHGIAGLIYDKRGSGASTGDVETATYEDLAADAIAAFHHLETRPEIDAEKIGFKGTSEGGWIAPLAASSVGCGFIIVVSTTAETPAQQVRYEVGELVRRAGFAEAEAIQAAELYAALSEFERSGEGRKDLDGRLRAAAEEPWFDAARYLPSALPPYEEVEKLDWFPAWRRRMDFDAATYWSRIDCPVLLLLGGRDPKMDADRAADSVREALDSSDDGSLAVHVFPHGEHGLVEWWLPGRLPPPRFPEGYPQTMVDWLVEVVSAGPG